MLGAESNQNYQNLFFIFPYLMVGGSMLVLVPFSQCYDTKRIEKHFSEYPEITSPSMGNS